MILPIHPVVYIENTVLEIIMWINLIGFNVAWFGLVTIGNGFVPVALIWLAVHLYYAKLRATEIKLVLIVALIGITLDSSLTLLGIFHFDSLLIPFWLMILWCCFAATLAHSLKFLAKSKMLQFVVGAALAPLSYIAGFTLSAVDFGYSVATTYLLLALLWGPLMQLLFYIAARLIPQETSHA